MQPHQNSRGLAVTTSLLYPYLKGNGYAKIASSILAGSTTFSFLLIDTNTYYAIWDAGMIIILERRRFLGVVMRFWRAGLLKW